MKNILVVAVVVLVGGLTTYVVVNKEKQSSPRSETTVLDNVPAGMHRMPDGSLMGNDHGHMDHMMNMLVSSEREFIEGMIPHHQEAIDTAREVIARGGTTPEIRRLVEDIVVAQEKEIADMKTWYESWYGVPYSDDGQYMDMMRPLGDLSGADLDRVFLEDMIMHHMGAIMMAGSVEPYIEHAELSSLIEDIKSSQSAEIAQMQLMLQGL
ncbi:MAG: DUF305 domain-containing protein [Candidatus Paceibacteria bacterium]